ncbi:MULTISPECIES: response regulator transcription factor [unclassified Paenibacillus]|uniref:response regulator transcription factor n=1 Tax=unclassified Paenibacillus TaxID=185978 RepID=UPI000953ED76|nr:MULTISPECIES: response regulator transcription factor [unclassified Paenibacillus]ASS67009.1 response regulator transcription factor [Paenibacillus sp. RUD330]SIR49074.1 DNA-binding response regulator, OmpR family, contains REC and winged-helix (wHTH) domain [Paenibacillus sp. RU4X]SIR58334.1 DNA-binding response regulator, OmpR family, contains REC and winged-helix (wHTH) domain [Paenibacillus sp. RU4T]
MRILLVEDEEAIRGFVRINLKRSGMEMLEAGSGEEALELVLSQGAVDIALLDVMLPGMSGFDVCASLREAYPAMGIIMLTAKAQEEDKIRGLELGADDYIHKPFSPGELMARIHSLSRRLRLSAPAAGSHVPASGDADASLRPAGQAAAGPVAGGAQESASLSRGQAAASFEPEAADMLAAGPFRLSERLHKLWKDGSEIVLTPTEWTLVKLLMERCGQSVSRDEILSEVWGRYYVGDLKVVDVNIRRIRQKIESNPSEPAIIETVWGYGYRWKRGEA